MSKRPTELWNADPHTLAKLEILRNYLESWFAIFGLTRPKTDILYIDGFAGPGIYAGGEDGSPVEALIAAAKMSGSPQWRAGKIVCAFIEKKRSFFESLLQRIEPFINNKKLEVKAFNCDFIAGFEEIEKQLPRFFKSELPLFAFIDPFGVSGAPFNIVRKILSSKTSEVLVNFDSDGIARNYRAYILATNPDDKTKSEMLLNSVFDSEDWKSIPPDNYQSIIPQMVELYKDKLQLLPSVKYVISFEMRGKKDQNNYYLIFASQHHVGLRKMKIAMKRIDQSGNYSFSDASIGQEKLFRFDDPTEWAEWLHMAFGGSKPTWDYVDEITLVHTPFENPKSMLSILDKKGLVKVYPENLKRRKGTFPDGTVNSIEFVKYSPWQPLPI